jgi:hypothetical protein
VQPVHQAQVSPGGLKRLKRRNISAALGKPPSEGPQTVSTSISQPPSVGQPPSVSSLDKLDLRSLTTPGGSRPAVFGEFFISDVLCGGEDSQNPNPDHKDDISA